MYDETENAMAYYMADGSNPNQFFVRIPLSLCSAEAFFRDLFPLPLSESGMDDVQVCDSLIVSCRCYHCYAWMNLLLCKH